MAGYPRRERERRVDENDLCRVVGAIFAACGMGLEDAVLVADTPVVADSRGIHSHGTLRVPDTVAKLMGGGVNPRGRPRLVGGLCECWPAGADA